MKVARNLGISNHPMDEKIRRRGGFGRRNAMTKKGFIKYGWIVLLAAGLAEAGSLTANFTNETAAGKQPLR